MVDSWSGGMALTKFNVSQSEYKDRDTTAIRDESMVERGVTKGGENTAIFQSPSVSFHFHDKIFPLLVFLKCYPFLLRNIL